MSDRAAYLVRYEIECWAVWSPGELSRIGRQRRKRGFVLELNCDDMRIRAWGPRSEGGWRWGAYTEATIDFIDDWLEYGGMTRFEDWMLGHLWCIIDMPRDMPPLPKEFWEPAKSAARDEGQDGIPLEYHKEGAPIVFRPAGIGSYLSLVMPMRR